MTLANFDWTDKDSVKWFVLLATGHEGPYALKALIEFKDKKRLAPDIKVWAEGMTDPLPLREVLKRAQGETAPSVPDLPPLPEDEIPPLPLPEERSEELPPDLVTEETPEKETPPKKVIWPYIMLVFLLMGGYVFLSLVKDYEKFEIRRYPKMTMELHQKIQNESSFNGWDKKLFFKEYMPSDQSHIWLVTSGFQHCDVEAVFQSLPDKLLSMKTENVAFKTTGVLERHVVEFSRFDFTAGNKIIPGLYEMDVKATHCKWDGFLPLIMNRFSSPEETYQARLKVVLFSKGAEAFNQILDNLLRKKLELSVKERNQKELFWEDLQQKLETLQAVALSIEQLFLDFLDESPRDFSTRLKPMINTYTEKFGSFLTSFVVENEKYFQSLPLENTPGASEIRNYELMVKLTSKNVGFESMKFIEEFQGMKKPKASELKALSERVRKTYSQIKTNIGQKIIQVSEDRSQ